MRVACVCFFAILLSSVCLWAEMPVVGAPTDFKVVGNEVSRDTVWSGGSLRVWLLCESTDSISKAQRILYAFKLRTFGSWSLERTFFAVPSSEGYSIGDTVLVGVYAKSDKKRIGIGFEDTERELVFSEKVLARLNAQAQSYLLRTADRPRVGAVKFALIPRLISKLGYFSPQLLKLKEVNRKWVVDGLFNLSTTTLEESGE